ncbi:MAG: serine/threonine protein kinase [Planctomycetes bacterium]|nr:serine/threonine protein kinase [Planctomycetota bacterium]
MDDVVLHPRYRIVKRIAEGGMGSIYLAEQIGADGFRKTVALKTIRSSLLEDRETLDLFVGEAKLVADLIHENILQVYHLDKHDGQYFIVMEHVFGKTLEKFVKRHQSLKREVPIDLAAFIVSRVCRGLDYAHKKRDRSGKLLGIVHRDVSPSNIILNFAGVVKLTDFGIAKALTMKIPDEKEVIMGKYPFMSPEMAKFQGTDHRSDIFSLALISFELLTGKMVYNVESPEELVDKMENYRIPNVMKVNPRVPPRLNEIVMKGLEINPADRWQSAHDFGVALEHFMYDKGYGPTNEKLAAYLESIFPEAMKEAYW